jgi:hypothetical protein
MRNSDGDLSRQSKQRKCQTAAPQHRRRGFSRNKDRLAIARALREIGLLLELQGGNAFKARARVPGRDRSQRQSHRLDMEPRGQHEALRRGPRFVLLTDADSIAEHQHLHYGTDMARRDLLMARDVLDILPVDEFRRAVRPASA